MEKFVVSKALAEQLIEEGYPQTGNQFMWVHRDSNKANIWYVLSTRNADRYLEGYSTLAAPISDELLEQLPDYVKCFRNNNSEYVAGCIQLNAPIMDNGHHWEKSKKLADSLAQLWLYCKKNGYLTQHPNPKKEG